MKSLEMLHMERVLDKITHKDLIEFVKLCHQHNVFDSIEIAIAKIETLLKYYRSKKKDRQDVNELYELEARWYTSLDSEKPDYSVYSDEYYVCDLWTCWVIYSRNYIRSLTLPRLPDGSTIAADMGEVKTVADLGCGFGYTTAALKQLFPLADLYGTNIGETPQCSMCKRVGSECGFTVVNDVAEINNEVDLIFASEYFEHIQPPTVHLDQVIKICNPKYFILANSFGAKSTGHFDTYQTSDKTVSNKKIGRIFNKTLRENNFMQVPTSNWNNRPSYWKRIEGD